VKKDLVEWVCIENGLWIKLGGEVSYAEAVESVQAWTTDVKRRC